MEHKYKQKEESFNVEIKADVTTEEQKKLINALGHIVTSNLCLLDTKLLNTCLNLLNAYTNELLSNIADYTSINDVELEPDVREKLEEFNNIYSFSQWK
jgi:hypothetical protein